MKDCAKAIGISKRSCYNCDMLLKSLRNIPSSGSHGKVLPWSPPLLATTSTFDCKSKIIDDLKYELRVYIRYYQYPYRRTEDTPK